MMHHFLSPLGSFSEREARLCFITGKDLDMLRRRAGEAAAEFLSQVLERYRSIIGSNEETQRNLKNEQLWIEAFRDEDIFDAPQDTRGIRTPPFGPKDLLLSLEQRDRFVEFVRFTREMVPGEIRDANPDIFEDPAFGSRMTNLDDHMTIRRRRGEEIEVTEDQREILKYTHLYLIGEDLRLEDASSPKKEMMERARTIALETLLKRYPTNLYEDYKKAIRTARPQLQPHEMANPALLLSRLEKQPSRLKAALRLRTEVEDSDDYVKNLLMNLDILVNGDGLALLAERYQRDRAEQEEVTHITSQQLQHLDRRGARERIERANMTFSETWDDMGGKEKFFAMALIGYTTYKMLSSESKFWSNIPLALGGVYLYRRFVMGDEAPIDSMGRGLQTVVDLGLKPIKRGLEHIGLIATPADRDFLTVMSHFVDVEQLDPKAAGGLATLAEAKLKFIANAFDITIGSDGKVGGSLKELTPDLPLYTDLKEIARKRNRRIGEVIGYLNENKATVSDALLHVFFLIGAGEDPATFEDIDRRRGAKSFAKSDDSIVRAGYLSLVQHGLEVARNSDDSFIDRIPTLTQRKPETEPLAVDLADNIPDPLSLRPAEKELYAGIREPDQSKVDEAAESALRDLGKVLDIHELHTFLYEQFPAIPTGSLAAFTTVDALVRAIGGFVPRLSDKPREALNLLLLAEAAETLRQLHESGILTPEAVSEIARFLMARSKGEKLTNALMEIQQMKYALLLAANNSEKLPLSGEDIRDFVAEIGTTSIADFFDGILDYVSSWVGISYFGKVDSLADIDMSDVSGHKDLDLLQERITRYQSLFAALRRGGALNPSLIDTIVSTSGGTKEEARELLMRLEVLPDDSARIDRMEQYFAQRIANSLVLAMLVRHRSDGKHTLDKPEDRFITPKEEKNLVKEVDQLFLEVVGTVVPSTTGAPTHDREGMWEVAELSDAYLSKEDLDKLIDERLPSLDYDNDGSCLPALTALRKLGGAWLLEKTRGAAVDRILDKLNGDIKDDLLNHFEQRIIKRRELIEELETVGWGTWFLGKFEGKWTMLDFSESKKAHVLLKQAIELFKAIGNDDVANKLTEQLEELTSPAEVLRAARRSPLLVASPGGFLELVPTPGDPPITLRPTTGGIELEDGAARLRAAAGGAFELVPAPGEPPVKLRPGRTPDRIELVLDPSKIVELKPGVGGHVKILRPGKPPLILSPGPRGAVNERAPGTIELIPEAGGTVQLKTDPSGEPLMELHPGTEPELLRLETKPDVLTLQPGPSGSTVMLKASAPGGSPLILNPGTGGTVEPFLGPKREMHLKPAAGEAVELQLESQIYGKLKPIAGGGVILDPTPGMTLTRGTDSAGNTFIKLAPAGGKGILLYPGRIDQPTPTDPIKLVPNVDGIILQPETGGNAASLRSDPTAGDTIILTPHTGR